MDKPEESEGWQPAPGIFNAEAYSGHERVVHCYDAATDLKAIIAIHSTRLGPALGGCRMWPYASEAAALDDVLRLSHAMTLKHALAGLPKGGGKSVILGDASRDKSPALFRAMGRFVEQLGGSYIVAEDVGTTVDDMTLIREETSHVMGFAADKGSSGDPSPVTAWGVFCGLGATVRFHLGRDDLAGLRVAVQGVGHVGYNLCRFLHDAGAALVVCDADAVAAERAAATFGATVVPLDAIYDQDVDVFAPCALGGILNPATVPRLRAKVVAGAANNQLASDAVADALAERGILHAPDYAINSGGVINLDYEGPGYDRQRVMAHVSRIAETATAIFERAGQEGRPPQRVADAMALEKLAEAPPKVAERRS